MTLFSPIAGLPYPALADVPNAQTAGQLLTTALDTTTIPHFASDAAVAAAIPSPVVGQCIMRTDIGYGVLMHWGHSRWIAESSLIAEATNITTDITFSSIPQYWSSLRIIASGFRTTAAVTFANANIVINADTGTNYNSVFNTLLYTASPVAGNGGTQLSATNWASCFVFVGASSDANAGGSGIIDIPGYTRTGYHHAMFSTSLWGRPAGAMSQVGYCSYQGTTPINSIAFGFGGNAIQAANDIRLYGIS